jgi:hypothetical protein
MRNANEVLRQKEADLARVRNEIEALKMIAPLLAEDGSSDLTPAEAKEMLLVPAEEGSHASARVGHPKERNSSNG